VPDKAERSQVIWRLSDGKPGHDKQSQGLAAALARLAPTQVHDIPLDGPRIGPLDWARGRFEPGLDLPAPWLILGAGHATHFALLAARRARGGRAVVLMKPSLPLGLFDLCLVPEHDRPPLRANVIATRGALNTVVPGANHDPARGLMLIGGPSAHYRWDDHRVAAQVSEIAATEPDTRWTLTTSRRTPAAFLAALPALPNLHVAPFDQTPPGWLEAELARCGPVWVSPDSVSMVYEALTAGCRVGLLDLEAEPSSRVARGVAGLAASGEFTPLAAWRVRRTLTAPSEPFNEAERCARLILARWPA
jgi:hypothetical protein